MSLPNSLVNWIVKESKNNANNVFVTHVNISSIRSKFDELKLMHDLLKAQIIIISETKIDQFRLQGYQMYRRARARGGGGLIAVSLQLFLRRD